MSGDNHPAPDGLAIEGEGGNKLAPDGWVYQCQACGKKSRDMYGNRLISYGFDESCALNCALVKEN